MTSLGTWMELLPSLYDWDGKVGHELIGSDLNEWLELIRHDYDAIDRFYLDFDIIAG